MTDGASLVEALPDVAAEVEGLLRLEGESSLASQLRELRIVDRCRCGDEFCATIYTVARPAGPWGPGHYTLALRPKRGYINVDILDGRIVELEILYRDEIRERLASLLP